MFKMKISTSNTINNNNNNNTNETNQTISSSTLLKNHKFDARLSYSPALSLVSTTSTSLSINSYKKIGILGHKIQPLFTYSSCSSLENEYLNESMKFSLANQRKKSNSTELIHKLLSTDLEEINQQFMNSSSFITSNNINNYSNRFTNGTSLLCNSMIGTSTPGKLLTVNEIDNENLDIDPKYDDETQEERLKSNSFFTLKTGVLKDSQMKAQIITQSSSSDSTPTTSSLGAANNCNHDTTNIIYQLSKIHSNNKKMANASLASQQPVINTFYNTHY